MPQPADVEVGQALAHVAVPPGEAAAGPDFGNFKLVAVSGTVFNDANRNGLQDSEAGLGSWTVFDDANGDGLLGAGESSTLTVQDGTFKGGTDLNFDLKKIYIDSDIKIAGNKVSHLNLDPLAASIGIGRRF